MVEQQNMVDEYSVFLCDCSWHICQIVLIA